jgi:hypothetical protein
MNYVRYNVRNTLTDENSAACVTLTKKNYEPDITSLAAKIQ